MPRRGWDGNIKLDLREESFGDGKWVVLVQDHV
jgi:hypothetical protein